MNFKIQKATPNIWRRDNTSEYIIARIIQEKVRRLFWQQNRECYLVDDLLPFMQIILYNKLSWYETLVELEFLCNENFYMFGYYAYVYIKYVLLALACVPEMKFAWCITHSLFICQH